MDTSGSHVIVAAAPLDITVLRVDLTGALSPQGNAVATFTLVRQLSIMSSGHPLQVSPATCADLHDPMGMPNCWQTWQRGIARMHDISEPYRMAIGRALWTSAACSSLAMMRCVRKFMLSNDRLLLVCRLHLQQTTVLDHATC